MTLDSPSRTQRRSPGNARLTLREKLALAFIAHAQPISTQHYTALLDVNPHIARRSLRKLRDLGYIQVHVRALHEVSWFTLTPAAKPVLARAFGRTPADYRSMRGIGRVNLEHHARTVDLYAALTVATARSKRVSLETFLLEKDIRAQVGRGEGVQVPDAIAVLTREAAERVAVAFEVDCGNESPSYVVTHKVEPYTQMKEAGQTVLGCSEWRVCCTVPTVRRRNRLVTALWDADAPEGLWYFALAQELTSRNILGQLWRTPRLVDGGQRAVLAEESPLLPGTTNCYNSCTRESRATPQNPRFFVKHNPRSLARGDAR